MRFAIFAFVFLALAGCQSTFEPGKASNSQPIASPITLGNAPVVNGRAYNREIIATYKQGQSGSITAIPESCIDVQRVGSCLHLRTEVKKVRSEFQKIEKYWAEIYRMKLSWKVGETVNYEGDLDDTEATATLTRKGNISPKARDCARSAACEYPQIS